MGPVIVDYNKRLILASVVQRPVVNYTNVLRATFAPISLRQKRTNLQCKYRKAAQNISFQKADCKMLVKLTPALYLLATYCFSLFLGPQSISVACVCKFLLQFNSIYKWVCLSIIPRVTLFMNEP